MRSALPRKRPYSIFDVFQIFKEFPISKSKSYYSTIVLMKEYQIVLTLSRVAAPTT